MNMSMPLVAAIVALSIFIGYEAPHDHPKMVADPYGGCVSLPQDLMDLANGKRPESRP